MNKVKIIQSLKSSGYKITPVRSALVEILLSDSHPLSVTGIISALALKKLFPNKSTIYREVEFLRKLEILKEVDFGDGKKRYEISQSHHHHIVCIKCNTVRDVPMEKDLNIQEKRILQKIGFKPIGHSLEFFGLCSNCQMEVQT